MTQHTPSPRLRRFRLSPIAALFSLLLLPSVASAESVTSTPSETLPELEAPESETIDARPRKQRRKAKRGKGERRKSESRRTQDRSTKKVKASLSVHVGGSSSYYGNVQAERRDKRRKARRRAERRATRQAFRSGASGYYVAPTAKVVVRSQRPARLVVVEREPETFVAATPRVRRRNHFKKSSWFHAGGGFGSVAGEPGDDKSEAAGRAVAGGGGTIGLFYGGGEVSLTGSKSEPFDVTAAGMLGLTLPTKGFQPMLGLRTGVGQHTNEGELSPHFVIGPQLGFLLRKPGKRQGVRVMADLGFDHDIEEKRISPEFFLTFSAVF